MLDLLPALNARGVRGDIAYSPLGNPHFGAEVEGATGGASTGYPVRMARSLNLGYHGIALRRLRRLIRGYDLVHCHSTMAGLVGRLATIGAGGRVPLVYTPHCPIFASGLPAAQRGVGLALERLLARRTARYIAVSQSEKRVLLANGVGTEATVACIYNGLDAAAFDAGSILQRADLGLQDGEFTIGCIDRLSPQKNQTALLRAVAQLGNLNWRLLLVGGGEMTGAVHALAAELGIAGRIAWVPLVADARAYFPVCDVIAHPSRWDSCPYTVLEAMAASRPVVASDVGGVAELLGPAGRFVAPDDIAGLTAQLAELAADGELCRSLGAAGRARLEEKFPLGTMAEATIAVYEEALG